MSFIFDFFLPYKYWVVMENYNRELMVIRRRTAPKFDNRYRNLGVTFMDGPFTSQEDAARALNFWNLQYTTTPPPVKRRETRNRDEY